MTNETATQIACVVDKSGSMHEVEDDAIGGFNQFLEEQREVQGTAHLTLTLFNHEHEVVHRAEPVESVDGLDEETYRPEGMTALLDAVGATIDALRERIESRSDDPAHERVLVLILTDGKENASSQYAADEVADMVAERDARDDWEFLFWGANIDAVRVADRLNIEADNVTQFASTGEEVGAAFGQMSQLTRSFRESGTLDDESGDLDETSS